MKVYAQPITLPGNVMINGPVTTFDTLGGGISEAIPYVILFAGIALLLMIIYSGFQLMTGAANPKQMEMGKKRLTYAIAGFLLIFFAFWIVQAVGIIFGIKEFTCVFGSFGGMTCQ